MTKVCQPRPMPAPRRLLRRTPSRRLRASSRTAGTPGGATARPHPSAADRPADWLPSTGPASRSGDRLRPVQRRPRRRRRPPDPTRDPDDDSGGSGHAEDPAPVCARCGSDIVVSPEIRKQPTADPRRGARSMTVSLLSLASPPPASRGSRPLQAVKFNGASSKLTPSGHPL